MTVGAQAQNLLILIPVLDDWECLFRLLGDIDRELLADNLAADILLVDDGSQSSLELSEEISFARISTIRVLTLKSNLGHQRAIAIGLGYAQKKLEPRGVLIMDGDGEDRPSDISILVREAQRTKNSRIIFASRRNRTEGVVFLFLYRAYQLLFRFFTGLRIRFGNFSYIPGELLKKVSNTSDIWNHYSAALLKSRIPVTTVECDRGKRINGQSKMNLINLIIHGLSALSVFSDCIGARAILASSIFGVLSLCAGILAICIRFATAYAIPGWATAAVGLSAVITLQCFTLSLVFVFLVLNNRNAVSIIPEEAHGKFISEESLVYVREPALSNEDKWRKTATPI